MEDPDEPAIRGALAARAYEQAFEALVARFHHKVFRLCCSILANEALAEDACQEVFLRIWKSLAGFKGEASISTWVYSISRNTCLTIRKREYGRTRTPPGDWPGQGACGPQDDSGLRSAVARLPEKYRTVLLLFYYEEKSYEEVSAMLGLPLGTVKTHLHRAKRQLVEELHGMRRI